jgi:hypothetical protein
MKLIAALLSLFAGLVSAQITIPNAVPMPQPEVQFLDQNGVPLSGAYLCTYAGGTSTPLATYTDSTAATPNTNPVVLDTYGRASVWVGPSLYKFVLRTGGSGNSCATGSVQWTQDNVGSWLYSTSSVLGLASRITVSIPGTLAIGSNLGPAAFYVATTLVHSCTIMVKTAPTGANLVFQVQQGSTTLFTVTIMAGQTVGTATGSAQTVPANTQLVVNITAVGTTFPGADATVQIN